MRSALALLLGLALLVPVLASAAEPTLLAAGTAEWNAASLLGFPGPTCGGTLAVTAHYVLKELRFETAGGDCTGANALWFSPCRVDAAGNIFCQETYGYASLSATGAVDYEYDPPGDYFESMHGVLTRLA